MRAKPTFAIVAITLVSGFLLALYQNCAPQNFSREPSSSFGKPGGNGACDFSPHIGGPVAARVNELVNLEAVTCGINQIRWDKDSNYNPGFEPSLVGPLAQVSYSTAGTYVVEAEVKNQASGAVTLLHHYVVVSTDTDPCAGGACPNGCDTPFGTRAPSGQTVTAFKPPMGCMLSCDFEVRKCTNGQWYTVPSNVLSNFPPGFSNQTCADPACHDCQSTSTGFTVANQSSRTLFIPAVACGDACTTETRWCRDGVLFGSNNAANDYSPTAKDTCTGPFCSNSCTLNFTDGTQAQIGHNQSYANFVYPNAVAPVGVLCDSTKFKAFCQNGVITKLGSDVVVTQPVSKGCCNQDELNVVLQNTRVDIPTTNKVISQTCNDSYVTSLSTTCGGNPTAIDYSFMGIFKNPGNGATCPISTTPREDAKTRFKVACGARFCAANGNQAGLVTQ